MRLRVGYFVVFFNLFDKILKKQKILRMKDKWIQKAIKKPGSLRKTAKAEGEITKKGTIDKEWLKKEAKKGDSKTAKRARLAETLGKMKKKK